MAAMTETIEWFNTSASLPDADTTVLVIHGGDTEDWMGYYDGVHWRCIDQWKLPDVLFWAHMPEGPQQ